MFEQFIDRKASIRHFSYVFILSLAYVFVSKGVQSLLFPDQNVLLPILVTLLLVPSLHHLISIEEKIDRKGTNHFWKRHHVIIRCYLGVFLGIFAGFILLGMYSPESLNYQIGILEKTHLQAATLEKFASEPYVPRTGGAFGVFFHNFKYLILGFILSLVYGVGSIFIIVYNASVFAAFMVILVKKLLIPIPITSISIVHMIPESAAYLLIAISGAMFSQAVIKEKFSQSQFKNVVRNCVMLLIVASMILLIAAFIETYVTANILHNLLVLK